MCVLSLTCFWPYRGILNTWLVTPLSVSVVCWDFLWADIRTSVRRSTTTELCSLSSSSKLTTNSVTWYKQEVMSDNRRNFSSKERNLPSIEVTKLSKKNSIFSEWSVLWNFHMKHIFGVQELTVEKRLNCAYMSWHVYNWSQTDIKNIAIKIIPALRAFLQKLESFNTNSEVPSPTNKQLLHTCRKLWQQNKIKC